MITCPVCALDRPLLAQSPLAVAFGDMYPVSPGHALVIPRRHAVTYFDCSADEQAALWQLAEELCARLTAERRPGFDVGFNAGTAAGQTVFTPTSTLSRATPGRAQAARRGPECRVTTA